MSKRRKQWVDNCPGNARGRRRLKRADRQFMKMIIEMYGHDACRVFIVPHPVQIDVLDLLPAPKKPEWPLFKPDIDAGPSWDEMRALERMREIQRRPLGTIPVYRIQSTASELTTRVLQDIIARDIEEGAPKKSIWQQALQGVDDGYKPSPEEIAEMEACDQRAICACGSDLEDAPRSGCEAPWAHGDDVYK